MLVYGRVIATGTPDGDPRQRRGAPGLSRRAGGGDGPWLSALLEVAGIETCYGRSQVLFGLSLAIAPGEMVTLMGRNGMGKTTTVRSIMGLTPALAGTIRFDGAGDPRAAVLSASRKLGIGLVPEGRQIFPNLTVRENLVATAANRCGAPIRGRSTRSASCSRGSPSALGNMGNQLSGGEQQMLAIGRALMTNPRLLILDEATEGLAPLIRAEIWHCLARLKAAGQSILVIDKNVEALIRIADRHYLIERGRVVWTGTSPELAAAPDIQHRYLGISPVLRRARSGRISHCRNTTKSRWSFLNPR